MTFALLKYWINQTEESSLKNGGVWYLSEKDSGIDIYQESHIPYHVLDDVLYNTRDKIFPSWYKFTTAKQYESELEESRRRSRLRQIRGGNTDIEF